MDAPYCIFCDFIDKNMVEIRACGSVAAFPDSHPVSKGHFLIIPIRHIGDLFDMNEREVEDVVHALHQLRAELLDMDPTIAGFNVGANIGEAAGQTVEHAHVHLIPRRGGDTPEPAGGIRGVIPSRMSYRH